MIRSVRTILKALAKEQVLTDEQMQTLMTECEKIINDRPITTVSGDPNDPPALTPSMLLLMKSNPSIPPGVFVKDDIYAKRWWKQIQYLCFGEDGFVNIYQHCRLVRNGCDPKPTYEREILYL